MSFVFDFILKESEVSRPWDFSSYLKEPALLASHENNVALATRPSVYGGTSSDRPCSVHPRVHFPRQPFYGVLAEVLRNFFPPFQLSTITWSTQSTETGSLHRTAGSSHRASTCLTVAMFERPCVAPEMVSAA